LYLGNLMKKANRIVMTVDKP